jgi:hypothetical protein
MQKFFLVMKKFFLVMQNLFFSHAFCYFESRKKFYLVMQTFFPVMRLCQSHFKIDAKIQFCIFLNRWRKSFTSKRDKFFKNDFLLRVFGRSWLVCFYINSQFKNINHHILIVCLIPMKKPYLRLLFGI